MCPTHYRLSAGYPQSGQSFEVGLSKFSTGLAARSLTHETSPVAVRQRRSTRSASPAATSTGALSPAAQRNGTVSDLIFRYGQIVWRMASAGKRMDLGRSRLPRYVPGLKSHRHCGGRESWRYRSIERKCFVHSLGSALYITLFHGPPQTLPDGRTGRRCTRARTDVGLANKLNVVRCDLRM